VEILHSAANICVNVRISLITEFSHFLHRFTIRKILAKVLGKYLYPNWKPGWQQPSFICKLDGGRLELWWYITLDFATVTSQNDVYTTQQMYHILIFFHNYYKIKDGCNKKFIVFCYVQKNMGLTMKGKLIKTKIRLVMCISGSTVKWTVGQD
jgi:hypothetical protein